MTLYTSNYLSYYLTLVGWIINDGIWNVLVASGVVALPFIVIVLQEWLRARADGADEGNKGVLSSIRIENRIWVAIVVILFAGMPMIPINVSTIQFDTSRSEQCQVNVAQPAQTGWQPAFTELNDQTALVPIWWFFVHAISQAITEAAVTSIPCGTDLRQIQMDIATTRIADPILAQEVADFTRDCYGPARAKLFMSRPQLTDEQMYDVSWIGSQYFQTTPGYYDSFHSSTPRAGWPYDPTRDAGLPQVPSGAGYPTCEQWWSDPTAGLRARLLQQVSPGLLTQIAHWAGFLTQSQVDNSVIRAIVSPRQQIMNQGQVYTDYGGQIGPSIRDVTTRAVSDVGITAGALAYLPAMDVVRQALPMVLALLKMAVVICLPLILVIGTYELKAVVTVSVVEFALFFTDFWFQLARWIDNTILDALYGWNSPHANFNPLMGINNTFGDLLLQYVMGAMFLVLPALWVTALAWTGIRVGNFLQGLANGTRAAGEAGAQGTNVVMKIAAM